MSQQVIIKSFQNGLHVIMDPDVSFETLLLEIENKFKEAGRFFQNAKLALSLDGRTLTLEEEKQVMNVICATAGIDIVCVIGKNEKTEQMYIKAIQQVSQSIQKNNAHYYRGMLKNNQILEAEENIVIIGDVYPGSVVISAKDILILGGLYGEAYAGNNGESGHIVVAMDLSPEKLKIGDLKYRMEKASKWAIKPKMQPKIAYVKENKIVAETLTKDFISDAFFR